MTNARPDEAAPVWLTSSHVAPAVSDPVISAAPVVVLRIDEGGPGIDQTECADVRDTLDWLRSPARFTIAVVQGLCAADAAAEALACDVIVMASTAVLNLQSPPAMGSPADGVTERLIQRAGSSRALLLLLEPGPVTAASAYALGLVDVVCEPEQTQARAQAMADAAASRGRTWVAETKALFAAAAGPQHEAVGRARLRRWEVDAAARSADEADERGP